VPINQLPVEESICGVIPSVPLEPLAPSLPAGPCADTPVSVSPINQLPVEESICGVIPSLPVEPSAPFKDSNHSSTVFLGLSNVLS
jgi:hypothetical protein